MLGAFCFELLSGSGGDEAENAQKIRISIWRRRERSDFYEENRKEKMSRKSAGYCSDVVVEIAFRLRFEFGDAENFVGTPRFRMSRAWYEPAALSL